MAAEHGIVLDFAIVLGASAVGGYAANRLRQPVILGYLASGLLVGPFGLTLVSDADQVQALAEIGVAFLLFALGVEFSLAELRRVKDIAIQGSLLQIGLTLSATAIAAALLGWIDTWQEGIFLGAVLSLSSTAVVLKTLTERGETNTLHGQIMLAILIVQDLALGLMLAVLPALNAPAGIGAALGMALLKAIGFLAAAFAIGRWVVPRVMRAVAATESQELFLLATIALCLGLALLTAALGLSVEMGAFVAGLTVSEIDHSDQALAKILPLRDTFASLFFASIGMLIDPRILVDNFGTILALVVLVMVGKSAIVLPVVLRFRYSLKTATIAAFGLGQIGEFSFVLAVQGLNLDLIDRDKYLLLLGTTAITLVMTPIWLGIAPIAVDRLRRLPQVSALFDRWERPKQLSVPETITDHVVVVGYGRVGQAIARILCLQGYPILAIENSESAVRRLKSEGIPFIFGDADSELVLEKAHLEKAKALVVALPDPASTRLVLQHALDLAPGIDAIARAHNNNELDVLTRLGAKEVVQPEFEAALELSAHLLATLGEPRDRIRQVTEDIRTHQYRSARGERT